MPEEATGGIEFSQKGTSETSLPKLTAEQVFKSQAPIISSNLLKDSKAPLNEKILIHPYGDYTVMLEENADKIQVLDKNGKKIEDFQNNSTEIIDWPKLMEKKVYLFDGTAYDLKKPEYDWQIGQNNTKSVYNLPSDLQHFAKKYIDGNPDGTIGKDNYRNVDKLKKWEIKGIQDTNIYSGHGCIVIRNVGHGESFIVFQTVNDKEIGLPPRNWKRFTNLNTFTKDIPENSWKEASKGAYALDNNYFAWSNAEGFFIFKSGQQIRDNFQDSLFADRLLGKKELCVDPQNRKVVYFCKTDKPEALFKLDTANNDSSLWKIETAAFPQTYEKIKNLQLDSSGKFLMFEADSNFVILTKDNLQEVGRIPNFHSVKLDDQGRLRGVDDKGHLVYYKVNLAEYETEVKKRQTAQRVAGIQFTDLFRPEGDTSKTSSNLPVKNMDHLTPVIEKVKIPFNQMLSSILNLEDVNKITSALEKLRSELKTKGLKPEEIDFVTSGLEKSIFAKQKELAKPLVAQGLTDIGGKLAGNLTVTSLSEANADLAKLKSLEGFVDADIRAKIITLEKQLGEKGSELFKTQGEVIGKDVNELVEGVKSELDKMDSLPTFADWEEFSLPQLVSRLGALARDCPLEAHELQKMILDARRKLQEIDREYGIKFKEKYAQVREKASETMTATAGLMQVDVDSFVNRLREKGLKDRIQANAYIEGSESLKLLRQEITELRSKNPDVAKELEKSLNVQIALAMSEIERKGSTTVAQTGQQMILFGQTEFPKWEGKVHEKIKRQVDVVFIPDEKTKGPGVTADKILGDIGIIDINSRGKVQKRRLYEGLHHNEEDSWRYGNLSFRGSDIFPSYVTNAEFKQIKKEYAEWSNGGLKKQFSEKRKALKDLYETRQNIEKRDTADIEWKKRYQESLADYANFAREHHVLLLERIDQLRNAPETEFANGSGYVPWWQSHWVTDEQTEYYLEEMAKYGKMQLDLQEGLFNLKGHAGSGKDVLVKMFSNQTNRPYFAIDCSKWTTEFELSEDVILEAEDGASKTVKIPSVVLNAITTPGAIMYFNEMNAMPEQAQIFLHGLMDEKRTLTLKTSSGKAIKAVNSVLLMGSMNPGYPGTFNPQFATKSRMMDLEIDYPPLYKEKNNPNSPISASEALRIARGVDSLTDFTYEANPEHNEFVKIWDKYVNGVQNNAAELTKTQQFDVDVILSLVQFGNKLREGFILKFEKAGSMATKGKLLIDQPITGREMRRCAYFLSKMPENAKITASPEQTARDLLGKFFLSHIDEKLEREKVETAMKTWTSSKRVASH